jgi:glutathione S-transferase
MSEYELYYWPGIQGRGEFVRLALEAAGVPYRDVARQPEGEGGLKPMMRILNGKTIEHAPFAPPFLKAGSFLIGQTANILMFLGARHDLAPTDEAGRLWANQLQLTITDFVDEIHDTHHPIASGLYYEDQIEEAKMRSKDFLKARAPKFLRYFECILASNKAGPAHLIGDRLTYPDLSLFQIVAGLRYAFPRAMAALEKELPLIIALHDQVKAHPNIAAYLASPRRIPFNEEGIFRHYPELDSADDE